MKIPQQRYAYFMSDDPVPVSESGLLWTTALPLNRHQQTRSEPIPTHKNLTYGEFFEALSLFLESHLSDFMLKSFCQPEGRVIDPHEISRIHIHLEKHGAFYHPARIILFLPDCQVALVANVAVSSAGKDLIRNEFRLLGQLAKRISPGWLPRVFGCGKARIDNHRHVLVFVGEWFEGFHEFHVSGKTGQGETNIRVWDPNNENLFLTRHQTQHLFEQAAMILTVYYDITTFEQISAWHHAAGDFVVCLGQDIPIVKLITVRAYEPLFNMSGVSVELETILNTLLIFYLNLTLRLRIDRKDGIGGMVWIEGSIVPAINRGFFKGLSLQTENTIIPAELVDAFKTFLLSIPEMDIREFFLGIVNKIDPKSPDLPIVKQNLDNHVKTVLSEFDQMKRLM